MRKNGEQMGNDLEKLNQQLSRVRIRDKKGYLYVRGQFPTDNRVQRKEFALGCKNTADGRKIALAKTKEIDAQLLLDKWEVVEKEKRTVGEVLKAFTANYWTKLEKTEDRKYAWRKNQEAYFGYLPEDEIFSAKLLKKAVESFPPASYKQKRFCQIIRPVAKFAGIAFNFTPYMQYQQPDFNIRELPTEAQIIEAFESEKYIPHKWGLGVLALFGLRPHELFRSDFDFENDPPLVYVECQPFFCLF